MERSTRSRLPDARDFGSIIASGLEIDVKCSFNGQNAFQGKRQLTFFGGSLFKKNPLRSCFESHLILQNNQFRC